MLTETAVERPRTKPAARVLAPTRGERLVETIATLMLLVPALPVMGMIWALVRLTSAGPAIYTQRRTGLRGREFLLHKFRSMTWRCEDKSGAVWATRNDPRVTAVGRILRKTHLDELPQLFDVLRGDMALVGPRPERPEIIERLVPEVSGYLDRLQVRPGVTGLAQIFLDADQTLDDVRRKIRLDKHYIANRSLWLDLRIVTCTALKTIGLNRPFVREILFPQTFAFVAELERSTTSNGERTRHHA